MITPAEIRARSQRLYPKLLRAAVDPDAPLDFPLPLRGADLRLDDLDMAGAIEAVQQLRHGAKESRGYGYSVAWRERTRGRVVDRLGRNAFPERIFFETREDLLKLLNREQDYADYQRAVDLVRRELPQLESWLKQFARKFADFAPVADQLVETVKLFQRCPRPGVFARELPLSVDTKFVERHAAILDQWLTRILPPEAIDAAESQFARRYGLREVESHRLVRTLDPQLQAELGWPWPECSLPIEALAHTAMPADVCILMVENQVNLLTLPAIPRTLALDGKGYAASSWRRVGWLRHNPLLYWGDLDVDGLRILSQLRAQFPQAQSLWMDNAALRQWESLAVEAPSRELDEPPHLTAGERDAFARCRRERLRIEQERIPQPAVLECLPPLVESLRRDVSPS